MTEKEPLADIPEGQRRRSHSQYMRRKNGERVEYRSLKEEIERSGIP